MVYFCLFSATTLPNITKTGEKEKKKKSEIYKNWAGYAARSFGGYLLLYAGYIYLFPFFLIFTCFELFLATQHQHQQPTPTPTNTNTNTNTNQRHQPSGSLPREASNNTNTNKRAQAK